MIVDTTHTNDIRSQKTTEGAYEWWYFDAISDDGSIKMVIIFYEGNPFSRRYIQRQQSGEDVTAADFPAVSISIYKNSKPLYYSFTEVNKSDAQFSTDRPFAVVQNNTMEYRSTGDYDAYDLKLKEKLPSGDAIVGNLTFSSARGLRDLTIDHSHTGKKHQWNLIQPKARVEGNIRCFARNEETVKIHFKGRGYHDHNVGNEPLKNEFQNWYWGRFHFKKMTLIYYLMSEQKEYGWLIDTKKKQILTTFHSVDLQDTGRSLYGLSSARKILLRGPDARVIVQQTALLDNGPFYQRFSSDALLILNNSHPGESAMGITEYLCPPRIYKRLYWPLTNMRIRYEEELPHWVQRSKRLYRWTW